MQSDDAHSAVPRAVSEYEARTPLTDAAMAECIKQGGPHEPYHGPLLDCSRSLERNANAMERERDELLAALQEIVRGDVDGAGVFHGTFSGSQCVEIASIALARQKGEGK